ncbi:MAG: hypothetical protein WAU24_00235 [Chitinophagaceae bacterium]
MNINKIICVLVLSEIICMACNKAVDAPKPDLIVQEGTEELFSDTLVNMIGYWQNVVYYSTDSTGHRNNYDAIPDEHFHFLNAENAEFKSAFVGPQSKAKYLEKNPRSVTLFYKIYGTCGECGGDTIYIDQRKTTLPLTFDKNGLWVLAFDNAFGGKTVWKYQRKE